jgi:hypothetical protein
MNSALRRLFFYLFIGLFIAGVYLLIARPLPTLADVGVHPILPGGSNIEPQADTPIQMASERIVMNVRLATAEDNTIIQLNPAAYGLNIQPVWYPAVAMVVADFTMHNPTTSTIDLTTWFPLASALESVSWKLNPNETVPAIASFQVMQNGIPIEYTTSQQLNPKGSDMPALPWASFEISYPPLADTNLTVSYLLPLTQAVKGSELVLYYIFQTGAGWAGPIGQAELIVNLPYPASSDTLLRISPEKLSIPYPMAYPGAAIPASAVMQGTQARWEWKDFEPTAPDDFAVWLVNPELWQHLQDAKAAVQAESQSGQAWFELALAYHNLATRSYDRPSIFSAGYLAPGIEAYQKSIELWPDNPSAHAGIALLTLTQYMPEANAPADAMQFVDEEILLAKELEAQHPELVERSSLSSLWADDALSFYYYNITATADFSASSTAQANQTQSAVFTAVPSLTPSPLPSLTPISSPSPSAQPASPTLTTTPEPADPNLYGRGMAAIIILAACSFTLVVILVILSIALVRRSSRID